MIEVFIDQQNDERLFESLIGCSANPYCRRIEISFIFVFADIHLKETLVEVPSSVNVTDACRITEVAHCLNCAHSAAAELVIPEASLVLLVTLYQIAQIQV